MNEFWQRYKDAHTFYPTRLFHAVGTALGIYTVVTGIVYGTYWFCFSGVFIGYGLAWFSHFAIEGNSPLSLKSPIKSLACDLYMMFLIFTFRNPK